jgi:hypothetical protein
MTKKDAVRQAMAALGNNAMPKAIRDWVKDNLEIEMTAGHASTTKGEILREARAATPEPPEQPNAAEPKPTIIEAVKQVLADRGRKTMPSEIVVQLKERFGLEIKPQYASKLRTQILGKRKTKRQVAEKPGPSKEETTPAMPAKPNGKVVLLDDILTLRKIVERVGADEVHTLIDAMTGL